MDDNLTYFLLGSALSIPIGILVNIATPKIQEWVSECPRASAAKRLKTLEAELDTLKGYYEDPQSLLFKITGSIFFVLLFLGLGNALWVFPWDFVSYLTLESPYLKLTFQFISFLVFLVAFITCMNYIRLASNLKNFSDYQQQLQEKISTIKQKQQTNEGKPRNNESSESS